MDGKLLPQGRVNFAHTSCSFLFDIFLPSGYNQSPPHVKYMTVSPPWLSPLNAL